MVLPPPPRFKSARAWSLRRVLLLGGVFHFLGVSLPAATTFAPGAAVRLNRSETLMLNGKNFLGAPKGQEFTVVQVDPRTRLVAVGYYKDDGTTIAVQLPADALEPSPPDAWADLLRGMESFRDGRWEEARRLVQRAAQDPQQRALATALSSRMQGALAAAGAAQSGTAASRQALATTLGTLRDAAVQLTKLGHLTLALALDQGADRLAAPIAGAAPTKLDRNDVAKRVAVSQRAWLRGRQSVARHRLHEATTIVAEGLQAEPNRPDLKTLETFIAKEMADATQRYEDANRMRRFEKGAVHALTAIESGLKTCADHPQLLALKKEMQSAFEERTSPPVTTAFLAAAGAGASAQALTEGHRLYTTRCTECHDLELVDSRGPAGWEKTVAGMAGRAHLNRAEQTRILDYLAAAWKVLEAAP